MAILTAPRCGVVPHSPNTALTGKPYRTITPPSVVGGISLTTKSAGSACSPAMEETFTTREGAEVRSSGRSR